MDRFLWLILNPAHAVDPPKLERTAMSTYDLAQTAELPDAARETGLSIPVLLGALCGLRRGEIVALRRRHVDLEARQSAVIDAAEQTRAGVRVKPPRSGRSRTVAISALVTQELRTHQVRQAEERLRLGTRASKDTFVQMREDGELVQPRTLTHAWQALVARTKLPRVRFHDLRHAHATPMLASGVHPKVVSERLGHSKVGITLDSHVLPGMQADAAARLDDALQQELGRRRPQRIGLAKR